MSFYVFDYLGGRNYEITALGTLCSNVRYEFKSEAECKNSAKTLGLHWAHAWKGPNDFPGCLYALDGRNKVYFNLSPHPDRINVNPKYAAICKVIEGNRSKFKGIKFNCIYTAITAMLKLLFYIYLL